LFQRDLRINWGSSRVSPGRVLTKVPLSQTGSTALHLAAFNGHAEVVAILLDAGADRQIQKQVSMFDLFAHNDDAVREHSSIICRLVAGTCLVEFLAGKTRETLMF
jgi:ankyrin repeat protein